MSEIEPIPKKDYEVIYADPPWSYNFSKSNSRKIENKYETMDIEDIKNLEVPSAKDSVLYLWATAPKLKEALEVLEAWGFEYKTNAIWDKKKVGMGYWFRGQHELLLVGKKGEIPPPEQGQRVSSVIESEREEHSKKPDKVRTLISEWYPEKLKIELFARERYEGWDAWGNEVSSIVQTTLKN